MLANSRALIVEEYLREKARRDAAVDHADDVSRRQAEAAAVAERSSAEQTLVYMQRDLEKANDTIRVLQGEKRTTDQMRQLYEEAKAEKAALQKEAIAAATEAESLRRALVDAQEKQRQQASDATAQTKLAQKLFEVEGKAKAAAEELEEKQANWEREKELLLRQIDQVHEVRDTVSAAYERGRRAAEAECEQRLATAAAEREDLRRQVERLESDLRVAAGERERLNQRVGVIPELELAINDLRHARNAERAQHAADHQRLRDEGLRHQREAEDWHVAYETAEKHKRAMQMQLEDTQKAYSVVLQERASLEARIELLQIQVADSQRLAGVASGGRGF